MDAELSVGNQRNNVTVESHLDLYRSLQQRRVGIVKAHKPAISKVPRKSLKLYAPDFLRIDVKYLAPMTGEEHNIY
ncbi:MAG: hypothetical protein JW384_03609 [Nitrosomonadaceae bacterium]|nr:hypothetical protein [Nitrosomonadaceae bacterium]